MFQTAEETFCNSIIKTIPSSDHAVVKPIAHAHEPKVSYRYIELLMHQIYFLEDEALPNPIARLRSHAHA